MAGCFLWAESSAVGTSSLDRAGSGWESSPCYFFRGSIRHNIPNRITMYSAIMILLKENYKEIIYKDNYKHLVLDYYRELLSPWEVTDN